LAPPRVAIVIPAFNEEQTIRDVVKGAKEFGDVIVSDDCSTDATKSIARAEGATVVSQGANRGYDSALAFGIDSAIKQGCIGVVTMDADGQHNYQDISLFTRGLTNGLDVVVGIRPQKARWMEVVFAQITNTRWGVVDPLCGMKGYSLKLLSQKKDIKTYDSVGTELLMFALSRRMRVDSVFISTAPRDGSPRFAGKLRANVMILKALVDGLKMFGLWSKSGT